MDFCDRFRVNHFVFSETLITASILLQMRRHPYCTGGLVMHFFDDKRPVPKITLLVFQKRHVILAKLIM